jgi:predicted enzyme related to lactoylglutathione lyase
MKINNVLASVPVRDVNAVRGWYETLFGRPPDSTPMPVLAEWKFAGGGCLQVYNAPDRAGGGSCTFAVSDIDTVVDRLKELGIDPGKLIDGGKAKVIMVKDPEGNSLAFAQAMDNSLAR